MLLLQSPPRAAYTGGQRIIHQLVKDCAGISPITFPDPDILLPPGGNLWRRSIGRLSHAAKLAQSIAATSPEAVFMDLYHFRSYGPAILRLPAHIPVFLYVQSPEALLAGDPVEQRFAPWFYIAGPARLRWYQFLARRLFQRADHVLALGPWLADFIADLGCPRTKITITGGGLPFSSPAPLPADVPSTTPRQPHPASIMAAGYVDPYKGPHRLIEALALVPPDLRPDVDWYGQTEHNPAYHDHCRSLLDSHGLSSHLSFHGWVDRAAMAQAWLSHDIFLSTAPHEGYGLVFGEALSHGLHLVAPEGSTAQHFISSPEIGTLYDSSCPASLAQALQIARESALAIPRATRLAAAADTLRYHAELPSPAQAISRLLPGAA
jgi:glycosyltransferase involved in cell wall biosynthesis